MKVYTMENVTEYVLESEMNETDRIAFSQHQSQTLAQLPIPNGLAEGDVAHYALVRTEAITLKYINK